MDRTDDLSTPERTTPAELATIERARLSTIARATPAQGVGIFLGFVEACLFGLTAALHFGFKLAVAGRTLSAPFLYPAGIVEAVLALALLISVLLPGAGAVRAGRVLGAQILAVIGLFASQVALLHGLPLTTGPSELAYAVALVLALASIALLASPAFRARRLVRP